MQCCLWRVLKERRTLRTSSTSSGERREVRRPSVSQPASQRVRPDHGPASLRCASVLRRGRSTRTLGFWCAASRSPAAISRPCPQICAARTFLGTVVLCRKLFSAQAATGAARLARASDNLSRRFSSAGAQGHGRAQRAVRRPVLRVSRAVCNAAFGELWKGGVHCSHLNQLRSTGVRCMHRECLSQPNCAVESDTQGPALRACARAAHRGR